MPRCNDARHRPTQYRARLVWLLVSMVTGFGQAALATPLAERIEWQKRPIPIALEVGAERLIHFPGRVRVGIPERLEGNVRIQNIGDTLYVVAHSPFTAMRVLVQSLNDGTTYVLDLSASSAEQALGPVQIQTPATGRTSGTADPDRVPPDYGYVALTRFASQQLYAPARLHQALPGVVRVPVADDPVPLIRGARVETRPLMAWRAGRLHLTAVRVSNRMAAALVLDPRTLRGAWLAAAFQHNRLHAKGSDADTTVLYLISDRPFATVL